MRRARARSSIVVYSAITDDYDLLKEQPESLRREARFVAFLDWRTLHSQHPQAKSARWKSWLGWELRRISGRPGDSCRLAKIYKILPHRFFPEAEYSLWMDGSIGLISQIGIAEIVERHLRDFDVCVFRHPTRRCAYEEAELCKRLRLDDPRMIARQMSRYRREGFPMNRGLAEASVILRRHTPEVKAFNEHWWSEILAGSRRDQLSFGYAAWKCGLPVGFFPGRVQNGNGMFIRDLHRGNFEGFRPQ